MRIKLEIYSTEVLKNFFMNFDKFFELSTKNFDELEGSINENNLSLVFLDGSNITSEKILKKICKNKNFIFICKDFSVFQKFSLIQKNTIVSPLSVNKLVDMVNSFVNSKKYKFGNTEFFYSAINNVESNEKSYLTQAETHILLKLFHEKNVRKKLLERDVLEIKSDLNTSSIESHLNRIRKKLKRISSNFTIYSKDQYVYLEIFNPSK
ncbi:helix-turn-helix domain-containing protein [Pelagibacterales bacterium SAG-MED31]|nr:helix-turn-helix domain-containing protein [Pelagibacterales bacterium SAG-MED31]